LVYQPEGLRRLERPWAYPLNEYTSSPLTSTPYTPPSSFEAEDLLPVPGTLLSERNFGTLCFEGRPDACRLALRARDAKAACAGST
jgi:hypothetical protein